MKKIISKQVLLIFLVLPIVCAGYFLLSPCLSGKPSNQMLKIVHPNDQKIAQLRSFSKQQRIYDKKLENKGYPHGYITSICGSEIQNLLLSVNESKQLCISIDGGKTWKKNIKQLPKPAGTITNIIEDEKRKVFYASTTNGVYRSRDACRSWQRFSEGLTYEHRTDGITPMVCKLSLDPKTGDIYAREALDGFGIYKTSSRKPEWRSIGDGLPSESITTDLGYSPSDNSIYIVNGASGAIVISGFRSSSMGVYRGLRKGQKYEWIKDTGLPVDAKGFEPVSELVVDPNSGELYACTYLGLFRKTQGKWKLEFNENFVMGVTFEKGYSHRSIAITTDKLFIRNNGKWQKINNAPWDRYASVYNTCFFKEAIYVATNDGLFVSRDNASHWERVKLPGIAKPKKISTK
ncbi:MAG: WD40/YVTN/BNR-like repeat-containing protein [Armatimonadota bacterium]